MTQRPGDVAHLPLQPAGFHAARSSNSASVAPAPVPASYHAVLLMPSEPRRMSLAGSLWDVGMLVTAFATIHEAEGVLVGEHVHAVLVDARLGPEPVATLCRWLRATGKGHVKVVVMGDEVDAAARAQLLGSGVTYVVPRPHETGAFARQFAEAMGFRGVPWR